MAGENVHEFTDSNFKSEVLESDVPVLVDFWAEWCQPCRMMSPTIDALAASFAGKVKVGKVDIDNNQSISVDFKIAAIPTVLIFKGGEVQESFVGIKSEQDLEEALNKVLA